MTVDWGTVIATVTAVTAVIPAIYLYWRYLDRRRTDVHSRTEWFQSEFIEASVESIEDILYDGTIESIQCYLPRSRWRRCLRDVGIDYGRTQVTIKLPKTAFDEDQWRELTSKLRGRGINPVDYGLEKPGCYLTIEVDGFDRETLKEEIEEATAVVYEFDRMEGLKMIPDA